MEGDSIAADANVGQRNKWLADAQQKAARARETVEPLGWFWPVAKTGFSASNPHTSYSALFRNVAGPVKVREKCRGATMASLATRKRRAKAIKGAVGIGLVFECLAGI